MRARRPPKATETPSSGEDDHRLFLDAIGPVRPLAGTQIAETTVERPPPEPRQSQLDEARVPGELIASAIDPALIEVGEELSHLKDGHSPTLLRKLKRGQFSIADEIDLHQMTAAVARAAIPAFLADCKRRGKLCVRIIHGKGLHSRNEGPVLKRLVDSLLRRRADVLAYASAKPNEGGTGATIVLLQRER